MIPRIAIFRRTKFKEFSSGQIGRREYLLAGLLLFLLKFGLDSVVAVFVFDQPWSLADYWPGNQSALWGSRLHRHFFAAMLAISLPFIWAGVLLTVARLRNAGLATWLALLFFVPVINLVFFAILVVLPSRPRMTAQVDGATAPVEVSLLESQGGGRLVAVLSTAAFGSILTLFDVYALGIYGVGLFVGLPFSLGAIAALLHARRGARGARACMGTAILALSTSAAVLFLFAFEGLLCLLMAAPIWIGCAALGGLVGYYIQEFARDEREAATVIFALALIIPVIMGAEATLGPPPEERMARSRIEVYATPLTVWRNVVAFPPLADPQEAIFRLGIAFPTSATIEGQGVGAMRRCKFSTGDFVEPIQIWNEPNLLRFSVTQNPPTMRELSIFDHIHPPHLSGFMRSEAGQFQIIALEENRVLLEGTTWYRNNMAPYSYWNLWSDAIIHRIHMRVLHHIKTISEIERQADAD